MLSSMTRRHTTLELEEQAALASVVALAQHKPSALSQEQIEDMTVAARTAMYEACQIPLGEDKMSDFLALLKHIQDKAKSLTAFTWASLRAQLQDTMLMLDQHASSLSVQQQEQQLQHALEALIPQTVIERHSVFMFLQQQETSHSLTVIAQLKHAVTDSSADFALLDKYVQLLRAAHKALNAFVGYMWRVVDQLPDSLRQHTAVVIKGLEGLTKVFVGGVHATANNVRLVHAFPADFFKNAQQQLNAFMSQCGIPQELQVANNLHTIFSQFEGDWGAPRAAVGPQEPDAMAHRSMQAMLDPVTARQRALAERLTTIKSTLMELLQRAHKLDVPSVSLLRSIRRMQAKLELGSEQLSDYSLKRWHFDVSQLQQKLKEYEAGLHKSDPLLSRVPAPEYYSKDFSIPQAAWTVTEASIEPSPHQLIVHSSEVLTMMTCIQCCVMGACIQGTQKQAQTAMSCSHKCMLSQVSQVYARLMTKRDEGCLTLDHARLRHLLEVNIKMQCWDQAAVLCQQLTAGVANDGGQAADLTQLSALSSVLTDRLAVDVETAVASMGNSNVQMQAAALLPKLHRELSSYRSQLLLSDSCLSSTSLLESFEQVARLCQPVQETLDQRPQHMLSLFTSMQAVVKQQQVVLTQLQGQTRSVSCTLQPVHLRLADLISLLCPQFRQACSHLMDVHRNAHHAMNKAQQVSRLDYSLEVGIASTSESHNMATLRHIVWTSMGVQENCSYPHPIVSFEVVALQGICRHASVACCQSVAVNLSRFNSVVS